MGALAVRCAIAARLDQISSAYWGPPEPQMRVRRHRPTFAPPPFDQIDLAERIYALYVLVTRWKALV